MDETKIIDLSDDTKLLEKIERYKVRSENIDDTINQIAYLYEYLSIAHQKMSVLYSKLASEHKKIVERY